jgi:hypothetical protein
VVGDLLTGCQHALGECQPLVVAFCYMIACSTVKWAMQAFLLTDCVGCCYPVVLSGLETASRQQNRGRQLVVIGEAGGQMSLAAVLHFIVLV